MKQIYTFSLGLVYTSSIGCQYSYHTTGSPQFACDLRGKFCNFTLTCHPQSSTPLVVRNCGDFYIYKSQPLPPYNGISLQSFFQSFTSKDGLFCGTSSKIESKLTEKNITFFWWKEKTNTIFDNILFMVVILWKTFGKFFTLHD